MGHLIPTGVFTLTINGHNLRGELVARQWVWECESFPDIPAKHNGKKSSEAAIREFTRLAAPPVPFVEA